MSSAGGFPSTGLLTAIRNAALTMAPSHARRLAEAVARHEAPSGRARNDGFSVAPVPAFRRAAAELLDAWESEPAVLGPIVATALLAAIDTAETLRSAQSLEVVWTGPSSAEVPVRLTKEVLLEVISGATSSLLIVSYAAYRVPEVVSALAAAAGRGVDVRLVLETAAGSGGRLSQDAATAFSDLPASVRVYKWAADRRTSTSGLDGAMHAKAAIADEHVALVTSANLTGSAIDANMELGLLVRGGGVPRRLARHFASLVSSEVLVRLTMT